MNHFLIYGISYLETWCKAIVRNYTSELNQFIDSGDRSLKRTFRGSNNFQGFNYSVLEGDDDFNNFVNSLVPLQLKSSFGNLNNFPTNGEKVKKNRGSKAASARKFFTLKQMIMYFQKTPIFGKFGYYGCWCFPEGPEDVSAGYGEPVDVIDR